MPGMKRYYVTWCKEKLKAVMIKNYKEALLLKLSLAINRSNVKSAALH